MKAFCLFLCLHAFLFGKSIETFYGPIEVEEPVLLELIESAPFQRLKEIHQYGVSYYTTHREEYTRYAHSIGVFTILREKNASLKEQIAGLLHDVSHTVFSHVGDWIFGKEAQEKDYQNSIHLTYLRNSGLEKILNKYGFTADEIDPVEAFFPALEKQLPDLCADRIDYNIQGAYYQGFITKEEGREILEDLSFQGGRWVGTRKDLLAKIVRYSLFMNEACWGSAINFILSRNLADAILRALEIGVLSKEEIHFGTDQVVWNKLVFAQDSIIQEKMDRVIHFNNFYEEVEAQEGTDFCIKSKFRGIDPWILVEGIPFRLTSLDSTLYKEYEISKKRVAGGFFARSINPVYALKTL